MNNFENIKEPKLAVQNQHHIEQDIDANLKAIKTKK
jgi:hypothetical protein